MPPSQRATNKRAFSVSFEKELIASVGKACEALGIDRTAFLKQAANELLARLKKEEKKNNKSK